MLGDSIGANLRINLFLLRTLAKDSKMSCAQKISKEAVPRKREREVACS